MKRVFKVLIAVTLGIVLGVVTGAIANAQIVTLPTDIISISENITADTAKRIAIEVALTPINNTINLYLNSPGGSITAGLNILQSLSSRPQINCYVEVAHSMAFVIMTYCNSVTVTNFTFAIQHKMQYLYSVYPPLLPVALTWYSHQAQLMDVTYEKLTRQYFGSRDFTWTGPALLQDGIATRQVSGFRCKTKVASCPAGQPYTRSGKFNKFFGPMLTP